MSSAQNGFVFESEEPNPARNIGATIGRERSPMSKPVPVRPTRPGATEADDSDLPVTPEVERVIRERLETFDEDAKAARLWEDVLADLKARRPLPPSPR
jgi:hypothetical protein